MAETANKPKAVRRSIGLSLTLSTQHSFRALCNLVMGADVIRHSVATRRGYRFTLGHQPNLRSLYGVAPYTASGSLLRNASACLSQGRRTAPAELWPYLQSWKQANRSITIVWTLR